MQITLNSLPIDQRKQDDGTLQTYFAGLLVHHTATVSQCLVMGDLCAFSTRPDDPAGHVGKPFSGKWKVGQILSLHNTTSSGGDKKQNTQHHYATVQWFWHRKSNQVESTLSDNTAAKKDVLDKCRPTCLILESECTETVLLEASLLPGIIVLTNKSRFGKGDVSPNPVAPGCFEIFYACTGQMSRQGTVKRCSDYQVSRPAQPPGSVVRAWKQQFSSDRQQALQRGYSSTAWSMTQKPRFVCNEPTPSTKTRSSTKTAELVADVSGKENQRNAVKRNKPKQKNKSTRKTKTTTGNKRGRPSKAKVTETAKVRAGRASKRRKVNQKEDETDNNSMDVCEDETSSLTSEMDWNVQPLSEVLYTFKKKKPKGIPPVHYYEGVELNLDHKRCHSKICRRLTKRWTLRVGDLIAVSCDKSCEPIGDVCKGTSVWFPHTCPWTPAQIVSIYREGDSEEFSMECRWFYRPRDFEQGDALTELLGNLTTEARDELFREGRCSSRMAVEVDEFVSRSSVTKALGRIVTTSTDNPTTKWLNTFVDSTGAPQLPTVCRYLYQSRHMATELIEITDWSNYGSSLVGPLGRGLLCEKAKPGQIKKLLRVYENELRKRFKLEGKLDEGFVSAGDGASVESEVPTTWPQELLDCAAVEVGSSRVLHSEQESHGNSTEFLLAAMIPVIARRCDSRATAKKSAVELRYWKLQIGDVICIAWNDIAPMENTCKSQWSPFVGPWRVGQVVSIYRHIKQNASASDPLLEIRWFLRRSELPTSVKHWMPPELVDSPHEELFESESVAVDVPASHVLGRARLSLGNYTEKDTVDFQGGVPGVQYSCRFFYSKSMERFQPLWCSSSTPQQWFQEIRGIMRQRGFQVSGMVRKHTELAAQIRFWLPNTFLSEGGKTSGIFFSDLLNSGETKKLSENFSCTQELSNGEQRYFFLKMSVTPRWKEYAVADLLFPHRFRSGVLWTARVGDIVAVRDQRKSGCTTGTTHSFNTPWRAAQIIAIYRDGPSSCNNHDTEDLIVEVQWLYRGCEIAEQEATNFSQGLGVLYETSGNVELGSINVDKLLGPVAMFTSSPSKLDESERARLWESVPKFLPVAPHAYGGEYDVKQKHRVRQSSDTRAKIASLVERGVCMSESYNDEMKAGILEAIRSEAERTQDLLPECQPHLQLFLDHPCSASIDHHTRFSLPPFHKDHGTGIDYYSEINVSPPRDNYAIEPTLESNPDAVWTVRLGDIVTVDYPEGFGSTSFGTTTGTVNRSKYWPMSIPWAVGEIVTIMHDTGRRQQEPPAGGSSVKSSEMSCDGSEMNCESVKLEIRWFYREMEVPGSFRSERKSSGGFECETIFESDHYDEISPSCLLSPVELHEDRRPSRAQMKLGMPVVQFTCKGFWSLYRRSLIPTKGLAGRIERGRAQSRHFGSDSAVRLAYESVANSAAPRLFPPSVEETSKSAPWKDAFRRVIQKMSLTDASKEGFENGAMLIGRERERAQLKSFLRSAITGTISNGNKASLFVAGPPGVGKTASIRAVVNELQREKSAGKLPSFEFIALNGMEMRHPFEAYIKLWEILSDDRSRCNAETAARKLESFFSSELNPDTEVSDRVSVVLLDEIDYLVTKKQTVLYNFFDWPSRAFEVGSKRRLVVIGVSNTLNLRDRLLPRVQSRIGSNDIYFKSYDEKQTVAILTAKMKQSSPYYKVFDEDAILFASKKTAALSGDIRKAFYICRIAAEMIFNRNEHEDSALVNPIVRIKDVLEACRESFNSPESNSISLCTPFEALLLISLAALRKSTGREVGGFDVEEILTKMEAIANSSGDKQYLPPPSLEETLGMLTRLGGAHIVSMETPRQTSISYRASLAGSGGPWPLVSMVPDDTAILMALKRTHHSNLAQKHLAASIFF